MASTIEQNPYRKITHQTINQLQIVLGAMEQHEPKHALTACKRIHELADQMRAAVLGINDPSNNSLEATK
jgi:hypothetical protein